MTVLGVISVVFVPRCTFGKPLASSEVVLLAKKRIPLFYFFLNRNAIGKVFFETTIHGEVRF